MFLLRNMKDIGIFQMKKAPYLLLCFSLYRSLGKCKRQQHDYIFLIFPRKKALKSNENEIICTKCQSLFSGKIKDISKRLLKFYPEC